MRLQEIKRNYFTLEGFEPFEVKQHCFLGSIIQNLGRFPTSEISLEFILHFPEFVSLIAGCLNDVKSITGGGGGVLVKSHIKGRNSMTYFF